MSYKIVNPGRYKKISKSSKLRKDNIAKKNIRRGRVKASKDIIVKRTIMREKIKVNNKVSILSNTYFKVALCIFSLLIISIASTYILNLDSKNIVSVFGNFDKNSNLSLDYNLSIGVKDLDNEKNILINELKGHTGNTLINIDDNYNISYNLAESITKVSDTVYNIKLKESRYANNVISSLISLNYLNTDKIEKIDEQNILVTLKKSNPYYIYYLKNVVIEDSASKFRYNKEDTIFNRNDLKYKNLSSIKFNNYNTSEELITSFKEYKTDMFITYLDDDIRQIGRHEYSIKKYRDGENYFIFWGKNNELLKYEYIRKSIAYSLNRNEISKNLSNNFTEVIDIPYIYSNVSYKNDNIGAENLLTSNGFKKINGIYSKDESNMTFSLIVNRDDVQKCKVADNIKEMLEKNGIRVNVQKLSLEEMKKREKDGKYDMLLLTVNINDNPDITYLYDYININENINNKIQEIEKSDINNLSMKVNELKNQISNEVACIGIVAKTANVVYQKYITGFDNISYMNIFKNIDNIGKIK